MRGLHDTGFTASGISNEPRKIRDASENLSDGTQERDLHSNVTNGQIELSFDGNRKSGEKNDGRINRENGATGRSNGEAQRRKSNEMGSVNEQHQSISRGNSSERTDLQLTYVNSGEQISLDLNNKTADEKKKSAVFVFGKKSTDAPNGLNYKIKDDKLGTGTSLERYSNNIAAIRLLKQLEKEERLASSDEQEILSKYVGWGGLSEYFKEDNSHYYELCTLLDKDELESAKESTLTAFYTPPAIIRAIYKTLENMNFKSGNILEPSCGIGNFMG